MCVGGKLCENNNNNKGTTSRLARELNPKHGCTPAGRRPDGRHRARALPRWIRGGLPRKPPTSSCILDTRARWTRILLELYRVINFKSSLNFNGTCQGSAGFTAGATRCPWVLSVPMRYHGPEGTFRLYTIIQAESKAAALGTIAGPCLVLAGSCMGRLYGLYLFTESRSDAPRRLAHDTRYLVLEP